MRKQAQAYARYIDHLEREEKRVREQAVAQDKRAQRYATAKKQRSKLAETGKLQHNRHREEVKTRKETGEKAKSQSVMASPAASSPVSKPNATIQPFSHSSLTLLKPKSVKSFHLPAEEAKYDVTFLRSLQIRTGDCTRRSEILRLTYKDRLRYHISKVNSTLQTTEACESMQSQTALLENIAKSQKTDQYCENKEKMYQKIRVKVAKEGKKKAKKAEIRRFVLENEENEWRKAVQRASDSKLASAAESLHTSLTRAVSEKQAVRSRRLQDWEANYALQCQQFSQFRSKVLEKEMRSFESLSFLQVERKKRLEAKLRTDFLLQHKRNTSLRQ